MARPFPLVPEERWMHRARRILAFYHREFGHLDLDAVALSDLSPLDEETHAGQREMDAWERTTLWKPIT